MKEGKTEIKNGKKGKRTKQKCVQQPIGEKDQALSTKEHKKRNVENEIHFLTICYIIPRSGYWFHGIYRLHKMKVIIAVRKAY